MIQKTRSKFWVNCIEMYASHNALSVWRLYGAKMRGQFRSDMRAQTENINASITFQCLSII